MPNVVRWYIYSIKISWCANEVWRGACQHKADQVKRRRCDNNEIYAASAARRLAPADEATVGAQANVFLPGSHCGIAWLPLVTGLLTLATNH